MNYISVMGNLSKDVEVRFTSKQKTMVFFEIAESVYDFKSKTNTTQFHKCMAWGKMAETISEHFEKGDKIKIGGHLIWNVFEGEDGQKRAFWRITVDDFEFCESKEAKELRRSRRVKAKKTTAKETQPEVVNF